MTSSLGRHLISFKKSVHKQGTAKAFDNRSRSKNLKPNKSRGEGQFDLPPPLKASRVKQKGDISQSIHKLRDLLR